MNMLSLVVTLALVASTTASAAKCTSSQQKTVDKQLLASASDKTTQKCIAATGGSTLDISAFCAESACIAEFQNVAKTVPNCVSSDGTNYYATATEMLDVCGSPVDKAAASATSKASTVAVASMVSAVVLGALVLL